MTTELTQPRQSEQPEPATPAADAPVTGTLEQLQQQLAPAATDPASVAGIPVLTYIGRCFIELRKDGRTEAWLRLQELLMEHIGILVPIVLPLKDHLAICRDIEEFVKSGSGKPGESAQELMSRFLLGDASLAEKGLDIPPLDVVAIEPTATQGPELG